MVAIAYCVPCLHYLAGVFGAFLNSWREDTALRPHCGVTRQQGIV
jgi:hypothetical protein